MNSPARGRSTAAPGAAALARRLLSPPFVSVAHIAAGVLLAVLLAGQTAVRAEAADAATSEALSAAIATLGQTAPGSPGAPALDSRLGGLERSPELGREFTDLAGAVLGDLAALYDGDPARMAAAVEKGRSDPEAFIRSLPPATRAKLEALSRKVDPAAQ